MQRRVEKRAPAKPELLPAIIPCVFVAWVIVSCDAKEGVPMHVSSQRPPVVQRWAQNIYLGVASLILVGIVIEGLLIGPSLFAATHWGADGPW